MSKISLGKSSISVGKCNKQISNTKVTSQPEITEEHVTPPTYNYPTSPSDYVISRPRNIPDIIEEYHMKTVDTISNMLSEHFMTLHKLLVDYQLAISDQFTKLAKAASDNNITKEGDFEVIDKESNRSHSQSPKGSKDITLSPSDYIKITDSPSEIKHSKSKNSTRKATSKSLDE